MELRSLPETANARERPPDALTSSSPIVVDVSFAGDMPVPAFEGSPTAG